MRIIDLTHTIQEDMPVYPGTGQPSLQIANTIIKDGFKETLLTMVSHTGTHMDAPNHLFEEGQSLDHMDVTAFGGSALVIDCTDLVEGQPITMDRIDGVRALADRAEYLLFHTGWDRYWGSDAYFGDYPCITDEVVTYMINSHKKGIGLDVISVDPMTEHQLPRHKRILGTDRMVIIENLTGLDKLGHELVTFMALPLKYENADGAPVRAVVLIM